MILRVVYQLHLFFLFLVNNLPVRGRIVGVSASWLVDLGLNTLSSRTKGRQ